MAAGESRVDLSGLDFEIFRCDEAAGFILAHGPQVRDLVRTAFAATLEVSLQDETAASALASTIVHDDEPVDYYAKGLADPYVAMDRHELNPALFAEQRLIAAYRGNDLVGINLSHNTSSDPLAQLKMMAPPCLPVWKIGGRRYAWQQLEALRPDERGHGIAEALGDLSLAERHPHQKFTAYTSPELLPGAARRLERYGAEGSTPEPGHLGGNKTMMVRYQGRVRAARTAMRNQIPEFDEAMRRAQDRTYRFPYQ